MLISVYFYFLEGEYWKICVLLIILVLYHNVYKKVLFVTQ